MILGTPNGKTVTITPALTQVTIQSVFFDLVQHTFVLTYGVSNISGQVKTVQGTIPAGVLTTLENTIQTAIENNEGWNAGTSTILTP